MLDYQQAAVAAVREYAKIKSAAHQAYVERICEPFHIGVHALAERVLRHSVTVNFHPDRLSNNGKSVMENLMEQGQYHGQFRTGTTNGGKTAYIGGDRFLWEQRLFRDAYPPDSADRPKYGALNLLRYMDGASARFGSCFFILNPKVIGRCTFAYGDSSSNPATLCTSDTFIGVLAELFMDVQQNGRLLNRVVSSEQEALAILLNAGNGIKDMGKNLDYCIEAHIHGDVSLAEDVDCFYADASFRRTSFAGQAKLLCQKYGIALHWIPERRIAVDEIGSLFRGPMIPVLAKRIDGTFGNGRGMLNAALIGEASCDSSTHFDAWKDIGGEAELFQYFKQLWHTVAYFG
ncbi:MAG: DUF3626 domain-containing protein [Clostridiaceae bacterium]